MMRQEQYEYSIYRAIEVLQSPVSAKIANAKLKI